MINVYLTESGKIVEKEYKKNIESGSWVCLTNPTIEEMKFIEDKYNLEETFITAALDEEEMSRTEYDEDNGSTLIIMNFPIIIKEETNNIYKTIPLGIIHTEDVIITICLQDNAVYNFFKRNKNKSIDTKKKSRFILQIAYRIHTYFLTYLRQIEKEGNHIEDGIEKVTKNQAILHLLDLQKSLVFFSTSLSSNELVLRRIKRLQFITQYDEDEELLEDTIIENKQAIDTAKIYSSILKSTMEAISSIINNNMNIVMKSLTVLTMVLSLPTMVYSWYGMNVSLPYMNNEFAYVWITLVSLIPLIIVVYLSKKRLI